MKTRVVFDCMLYLQAAAAPHRVTPCFAAIVQFNLDLCLSEATLDEVRDVLTRPALRRKFPALTPSAVGAFLADITARMLLIPSVPALIALPRDPKDANWLDLAVAAQARYLVTRDNDLLDLHADRDAIAAVRSHCPSLEIVDPGTFVRAMTGS